MMYFWIFLVGVAVWAIWKFGKGNSDLPFSPKKEDPLDILKRRFAKGEIDKDEYEERKAELNIDKGK